MLYRCCCFAGTCFVQLKDDMKKVYAVYCRNHDDVISLLEKVCAQSTYQSLTCGHNANNSKSWVCKRNSFSLPCVLITCKHVDVCSMRPTQRLRPTWHRSLTWWDRKSLSLTWAQCSSNLSSAFSSTLSSSPNSWRWRLLNNSAKSMHYLCFSFVT